MRFSFSRNIFLLPKKERPSPPKREKVTTISLEENFNRIAEEKSFFLSRGFPLPKLNFYFLFLRKKKENMQGTRYWIIEEFFSEIFRNISDISSAKVDMFYPSHMLIKDKKVTFHEKV